MFVVFSVQIALKAKGTFLSEVFTAYTIKLVPNIYTDNAMNFLFANIPANFM